MAEIMTIPVQLAKLEVSADEFNLIIAGLKQLPYILSQPVIDRLREAVKSQVGE